MPSSIKLNINEIKVFLSKFKKDTSILDAGAGAGDWNEIFKNLGFQKIDALEIWQPYIEEFKLSEKYNKVINADIRDIAEFNYDLVFIGDMLEHLTPEAARKVLDAIYKTAKVVLITIPYDSAQGVVFQNPNEIHRQSDLNDDTIKERYPELIKLTEHAEKIDKNFFKIATWYWQKENIESILETSVSQVVEIKVKDQMRIVHFSNWAPRKSGLYECTKDQIKFERKLGLDSQMAVFEFKFPKEEWIDDDWLKPITWDQSKDADLWVLHRGLPGELGDIKKKQIMVIHGTSDYLILDEITSKAEHTSFNTHINLINNCDASTAVNDYDYEIYKLYDYYSKLSLIRDSIDLERFNLEGYKYPFMHHPQILFCDSMRINKHPAHMIWAMEQIVKAIPTARLTLISLDLETILTWRNILLRSKQGNLFRCTEMVLMEMTEIRPFLRGADILYNGNLSGIFSRVQMEAMACGCQVIGFDNKFTPYKPKSQRIGDIADCVINCWEDIKNNPEEARIRAHKIAQDNFDMEKVVKEKYIPLYEKILSGK